MLDSQSSASAGSFAALSGPGSVVLNAVLGSTTGADVEYIELFGAPGLDLSGLSVIVIESDAGASNGAIDSRVDLGSGAVLGENGFFLIGNTAVAGTYGVTPDLIIDDNFIENSSYTIALVETSSLTGATVTGSETVIDAVGVTDGDAGDSFAFGAPVVGPNGSFLPAGVGRVTDGLDTDAATDFGILDFNNDPSVNTPTSANGDTGGGGTTVMAISEIQGAAHVSPFEGQAVTTSGIVTAKDTNGFYLQDPVGDGDIATSDAIFVFTGEAPAVAVGDAVVVSGTVSEFTPGGTATGNLSTTQIAGNPAITVLSSGNPLPAAEIIGQGGRVPIDANIDDDSFAEFEPELDGIDFFESLEAMLVTAQNLVAVAGTNRFGEIFGVVDAGADATGLSMRGTLNISPDDFNPERIQIDEDSGILPGFAFPQVTVGDGLGDVTGVLGYGFGNFEIYPTQVFSVAPGGLAPEVSALSGGAEDTLSVAAYNVLNLDPNDADGDTDVADGRFEAIAAQILGALGSPDIIALQEVQDNSGSTDDGTVAADQTLQTLVDAIAAQGGPTYSVIDNTFIGNNTSGGQPGGNIRTAYLYDDTRVDLVAGSVSTIGGQGPGEAFEGARLPLVADFVFNGETVTLINNHFSSKGGSAPILGVEQPFEARQEDVSVNGSLDERQAQSAAVQAFVATALDADADANIVALGDFNEFEFVSPVLGLAAAFDRDGNGMNNLTDTLPEDERYSFIFQGNSQSLDHILVSDALEGAAKFEVVHTNTEFPETPSRASDHDPILASLSIPSDAPGLFTLELLHIADQEASTGLIGDIARASGVFNALEAQDLGDDGLPDNTIRLSSGDAIIPGVFYDAAGAVFGAGGIADIQVQNELELQAIALGNHEFDNGPAELADLITGAAGEANTEAPFGDFSALVGSTLEGQDFTGTAFPYLAANLDFSTEPALAALEVAGGQMPQPNSVSSSTVIDVNGEPIGVVGAVTPNLGAISTTGSLGISPTWASGAPTPAELDALAAVIQLEVDDLITNNPGLNKIVLLAHMQAIGIELGLAERLSNVDVIVAGGSNTRLFDETDYIRPGDSNQGEYPTFVTGLDRNPTAVVNTDGSYKYVGRLVIDFDEFGNIIPESYDPVVSGAYATDAQGLINVNGAGLIDPEIQAITDAIEKQIIATEGNVFGISSVFLNGNRSGTFSADDPDGVRTQETNLGNLTADANLAIAQEFDPSVVVSIKNGGGIRADIGETVVPPGGSGFVRTANSEILDDAGNVVKPAGGISQNDISTTLAFNNDLTLLTLTRAELVAVLEWGVSLLPDVGGQFPQVAGVQFSFDQSLPAGDRIQSAAITDVDGTDIDVLVRDGEIVGDAGATVRIVTLNFLAGGGDGYPFPTGPEAQTVVLTDLDGDGVDDGIQTGAATFADDGSEQDALAEYLAANFADASTAFAEADTGPAGDERIQNLAFRDDTVLDAEPPATGETIIGTTDRDRLVGTNGDDILATGPGRYETMAGGLGADTFVFGAETLNGVRERDIITDFEIGIDVIALVDGAQLGEILSTSGSVVISFIDPDGQNDAVFIRGEGVTEETITISFDDPFAVA